MIILLLFTLVLLDIIVFFLVKKLSIKTQIIILLLFFGYFILTNDRYEQNYWVGISFLPFFVIFFCNGFSKIIRETLFEKKFGFSIVKTFCTDYIGLIIVLLFHIQLIIQLIN